MWSKRGGVRRRRVLESPAAACGEGGGTAIRRDARGERRVIEAWRPVKGRYLLALCTYGRLSNQEACLHMYLALAALLNRTLVIPRHGYAISVVAEYRWQWGVIVNVPHMRSCLMPHYPSPEPAATAAAASNAAITASGGGAVAAAAASGNSNDGTSSSSSSDNNEWSWQAASGEVPTVISQDEYEALEGRNLTVDRIACVVPHTCLSHPQMVFKALSDISFSSHLEYPPLHSHQLDELQQVLASPDAALHPLPGLRQSQEPLDPQGKQEPLAAPALASASAAASAAQSESDLTVLQAPGEAPPFLTNSSSSSSSGTSSAGSGIYASTAMLSLGDLNGLTLSSLPFDMFSPHPPFRLSCVDLWQPPPPVEGFVTGFIDTFLGGDYAAVHLRSGRGQIHHEAAGQSQRDSCLSRHGRQPIRSGVAGAASHWHGSWQSPHCGASAHLWL
ncbi:hypothetical protein CLOM_g19718 [Closterium sp. NIES-68]|nr:hypothetical protein CLOM_g19718 [Closterium sp. NIES-68]GJP62031.1 hypothetical protein CLOP_g19135 [Closterium sp. NIES-67]